MLETVKFVGDYSRIFAALAALAAVAAVALLIVVDSASAATRDTVPPRITGVSPAETSVDVAVTTNVTITFSENMKRKTVNETTFRLFNSGVNVRADVSCGRPCRTAKLHPKQGLKLGIVYQASVRGGRKGPKDLAGNGLTSGMRWSFSTASTPSADATKPAMVLGSPAQGATYALEQYVKADYSCQDEEGGSGLKSCEGTVANGTSIDTASAGQKSFTLTATDNAGNTSSVIHTYTVSNCTILGTADNDVLEGTAGDDVICGFGGRDVIKGLGGNDIIKGGADNDTLLGGEGDDTIEGGDGYDTASFENASQGIEASLMSNIATGDGTDQLVDIERLLGSVYDDTLEGSDRYNALTGNAGDDTLWGRGGGDILSGWMGKDEVHGGLGNDNIRGGTGADKLFGEDGDDSLNSQDGVERNDSLDGGSGTNTCITDAMESSITNCQ